MEAIGQLEHEIIYSLSERYSDQEYVMLEKFIKHIIEDKNVITNPIFRTYYVENKIMNLCNDFMESIGYGDYFKSIRENIIFVGYKDNDKKISNIKIKEIGCYRINGKKCIVIFMNHDIKDLYQLVHEIMHCYNMENRVSIVWSKLTETMSFLIEYLLTDYLDNINYNDNNYHRFKQYRLFNTKVIANLLKLEFMEIDKYLKTGIINLETVRQSKLYFQYLRSNNFSRSSNIEKTEQYIYAIMFASYIHERKLKNNSLDEFNLLNDTLANIEFREFLNFIDLDLKNSISCDLTEESYQKIFKSYDKKYRS